MKKKAEEKTYPGFGESHTVREWAKLLKTSAPVVARGLRMGHTIERIAEVLREEPENTPEG